VLIVLDLSGSMSDDDGTGRVKLDGARRAIDTFLQDMEPGTEVGLWTYPGTTSDCSPGGVRIPVSPVDTARMSATVRSLSASGQTPTAAALRAAANELPTTGARTVVLVSDGESNCNEAPCPVAGQLAQQGIDLSINTIGFRISDPGRQELTCIADAARGRYKDVQDSSQLADELHLQTSATLEMELSHPAIVAAAQASAPGGGVEVTATIRNSSPVLARNVQAFLGYDVDSSPGSAVPRRRLGNLAPQEEQRVTWRFRPLLEFRDVGVSFQVTASAANAADVDRQGRVQVSGNFTASDGGPLIKDRVRVAILGDSYSAGEGTFDYLKGTDTGANSCHRSSSTYTEGLYADRYVIACSGAVTNDVLNANSGSRDPNRPRQSLPAQIDQLSALKKPVDAAFLTIGGDDVGFRDIILACVRPGDCDGEQLPRFLARLGNPSEPGGLPDALRDVYWAVHGRLNSASAKKARGGRTAPIVVLAYPQVFPENPSARNACVRLLSTKEIGFANTIAAKLNRVVSTVVQQVRSQGVPIWFAPEVVESLLPDHTMCDKVKWVNYVNADDVLAYLNDRSRLIHLFDDPAARRINASFHPTKDGYHAMTAALVRWSASTAGLEAAAALSGKDRPPGPVARVGDPVKTIHLDGSGPTTVGRGSTYTVVVEGLPPGATVDLVLRSSPRVLARVPVDSAGRARANVAIPLSTPAGRHALAAQVLGASTDARQIAVTVTDAPVRHARLLAAGSAGSFLAGIACVVLGSRRRRRRSVLRQRLHP